MDTEIKKDIEDGILLKSAEVQIQDVTDEDLKKINKFTLSPLKAEEVFTFKVTMGDNETDDRNYEPFNLNALKDLKKLYVGKTVIKDHYRKADNQVARIYDTELVTEAKTTGAGEPFTRLVAKCYMVKTSSNADLITEIKAGIKKEVSTGCRPKKLICSVCGTDNTKTYCQHWSGVEYEGKTCLMTIDGCKEAYELSLVAVPAQPRAGTTKRYKGADPEEKPEIDTKGIEKPNEEPEKPVDNSEIEHQENKDLEINARVKASESFIFATKHTQLEEEK